MLNSGKEGPVVVAGCDGLSGLSGLSQLAPSAGRSLLTFSCQWALSVCLWRRGNRCLCQGQGLGISAFGANGKRATDQTPWLCSVSVCETDQRSGGDGAVGGAMFGTVAEDGGQVSGGVGRRGRWV